MRELPMIGLNDQNEDVKTVRGCLFARGQVPADAYANVDRGLEGWLSATLCDAGLVELIRKFQQAEGITADGIVGPVTWPPLLRIR